MEVEAGLGSYMMPPCSRRIAFVHQGGAVGERMNVDSKLMVMGRRFNVLEKSKT